MAAKRSAPQDELAVLFPEEEMLTQCGAVTVSPFRFGDFKRVIGILKKYADALTSEDGVDFVAVLLEMGEEALDDLATLTEFSTGKNRDFLDELPGNDAMELFFKVAEVNADFFVRTIKAGSLRFSRRISPEPTAGEK